MLLIFYTYCRFQVTFTAADNQKLLFFSFFLIIKLILITFMRQKYLRW